MAIACSSCSRRPVAALRCHSLGQNKSTPPSHRPALRPNKSTPRRNNPAPAQNISARPQNSPTPRVTFLRPGQTIRRRNKTFARRPQKFLRCGRTSLRRHPTALRGPISLRKRALSLRRSRYRSVTTDSGILGFVPGTKVSLIRQSAQTMHVTDARAQGQVAKLIASQASFVSVIEATYGCPGRSVDVTAVVQARFASGEHRIHAGNDLSGDPAFGCSKTLTITYMVGGGPATTENAREGGSITLPAQPAPPPPVTETRAPRIPSRAQNPLDRPAYDQKLDVSRPSVFCDPRKRP